jgi:hypothetical protein
MLEYWKNGIMGSWKMGWGGVMAMKEPELRKETNFKNS